MKFSDANSNDSCSLQSDNMISKRLKITMDSSIDCLPFREIMQKPDVSNRLLKKNSKDQTYTMYNAELCKKIFRFTRELLYSYI